MNYAIPISLLVLTIAAFFALGRRGFASFGAMQSVLRVLAALPLVVSGVLLHFIRMQVTASIIPPAFPTRPFLVVVTGLLEIAGAIGLFLPKASRAAAFWIAIMMVAIFPANVYVAGKVVGGIQMPGVAVRTAMQIVYIVGVLLAGFGRPVRKSPKQETS